MATVNWKERAHREVAAIIADNFGNPALPELLWLKGYHDGTLETADEFRESTSVVVNDLRNASLSDVGTPTDDDEAA